jgi:anti-sigma regulatory factor (Ser/Thr protein kinase)
MEAENNPGRGLTSRRWFRLVVLVGIWTLPGVLVGSQLYFHDRVQGLPVYPYQWPRYVIWQLVGWYFWIPVTPFILLLGRRVPVGPGQRWPGIVVHVVAAAAMALFFAIWNTLFARPIAPRQAVSELDPRYFFESFALQRFHTSLLTYLVILGAAYGIDVYRQHRRRELQASQLQTQLAQAQLEALRMQLHPHFLFNTLNGIAMLVRKGGQQEAVKMLAGLSDLLRLALENAGTQVVTLEQELSFLERYLELQRIRYRDRLKIKLAVAPDTLSAEVPNLILQPIVENAIRHGVDRSREAGLVEIRTRREDGRLRMEVRDDGPGFSGTRSSGESEGVGLTNTRKRLERLYGSDHLFEIGDAPERGALAVVEIPFRRAGETT